MPTTRIDHADFEPTQQLVTVLAATLGKLGMLYRDDEADADAVTDLSLSVDMALDSLGALSIPDHAGMLRVLEVIRAEVQSDLEAEPWRASSVALRSVQTESPVSSTESTCHASE